MVEFAAFEGKSGEPSCIWSAATLYGRVRLCTQMPISWCYLGRYKAIGGGSPLRRITEEQADALSQALRRKGQEASVYVAMRYWKPFTEDAIEQARSDELRTFAPALSLHVGSRILSNKMHVRKGCKLPQVLRMASIPVRA